MRAWEKLRGKRLPLQQVEPRRRTARDLNLGRHLDPGHGAGWTKAELRLLGKLPNAEVAARTGRGENAVRVKQKKRGIPNPSGHGWSEEELAMLGTAPDAEVAARIGRTEGAVTRKRCRLGLPTARDRRKPENR